MLGLFSTLSTLVSIVGAICFFAFPPLTYFCGAFSLLNSFIQLIFGEQKNLTTEISTAILGLIVALLVKGNILLYIAFMLCIGEIFTTIIGWILIAIMKNKY